MSAQVAPFPPTRTPDPAAHAALAELMQLGLTVARVASRLAEVEGQAVEELAEAAEQARAALATPASLGDAIEAGRNADAGEAARAAVAARLATITECFDKAARAVRRTVALQARLADPRPFRTPPPGDPARSPASDAFPKRPANDAERPDRPDRPENGDEIGARTDEDVLRDIRRDLAAAAGGLPPAPGSAPLRSADPRAASPDSPPPVRPAQPRPPDPAHPP